MEVSFFEVEAAAKAGVAHVRPAASGLQPEPVHASREM
jgi:hypothetical protein